MTTETKYSERDLAVAQRVAFKDGGTFIWRLLGATVSTDHCETMQDEAARRYALPKSKRPRVVKDSDGCAWRVVDGALEWRTVPSADWSRDNNWIIRPSDVPLLASLLATPDEEYEP